MKSTQKTTGKTYYSIDRVVKLNRENYNKIKDISISMDKDISFIVNALIEAIKLEVKETIH